MADDSQEDRTEAPTPKRRREAEERGQIARSPEVGTALLLLAAGGALRAAGPRLATYLADTMGASLGGLDATPSGIADTARGLSVLGTATLAALAPLLLALTATAAFAGAIQARGVISFGPLAPDLSRIDPLSRAGQLWGWRAVGELPKSLLRLVVLGWALWAGLEKTLLEASTLSQRGPTDLAAFLGSAASRMLLAAGSAYLVVAGADYAYQWWRTEKQLGMTRDEVRKEAKESEGDPAIKMRRRSMARQLARRRMMRGVETADVVVTNPTHIAVALRYDPNVADAPTVVAMGERKVAQRIKEIARAAGVPVVEDKPLARSLLATGRVGEPIPVDLFVAVAGVLAWVYRVQGTRPRAATAGLGGDAR